VSFSSVCARKLLSNVYIADSAVYVADGISNTRGLSMYGMWTGI